MSPSGIDGPRGPGGPKGPGAIDGAEGVERSERPGEPFSVGELAHSGDAAPAGSVQDPVVMDAVTRAAEDLEAGRIADMRAAVDVVIEAIVTQRYPGMAGPQQQRLTVALQRLLADDPGLGAQIAALIQSKHSTG